MTSIIHISDLHIGQPGADVAARRLVAAILDDLPDVIIITGDITDDGFNEQYAVAFKILRPLVRPDCLLLIVPGNHDVGPKGVLYDRSARERFRLFVSVLTGLDVPAGAFPFVYTVNDCRFICLDTCTQPTQLARGRVGYLQRQALARELEAAKRSGLHTVVAAHHHPFDVGFGLELTDSAELLATLSHRTDLLLFGHKHQAAEWSEVFGVRRILASCKSTETMRYRRVEIGERIAQKWVVSEVIQGTTKGTTSSGLEG